jgi:hypothetical protein
MPLQSGRHVSVRYKVQSGLGSPASGASGKELPFAPSAGFSLAKVAIDDPTVRSDGMTLIARHGSRSVSGSYDAVARLSALDEIIEAIMRGTFTAASTITSAVFTTITTTTSTIVFAAGNPITAGVRRGQVIRLNASATVGNNNRNLNVTNVSATTITVSETLTLNASPDATAVIQLPKRVTNGATPVDRYFTLEEYHQDIDQSELATDVVFSSMSVALQPDNTAMLSIGVVGRNATAETTGASPILTSPTTYTTTALIATDARLIVNGVAVTDLTGLSFDYDLTAATVPVIGSVTSPDVFKNQATLSGSFSAMRSDLTRFEAFLAESTFGIAFTLVEPTAEPKGFLSFYIPFAKYNGSDAALGSDNAMIETLPFSAGIASATGDVAGMLSICTSAA